MSNIVSAELNIELNLTCPNCDELINLFDVCGEDNQGRIFQTACPVNKVWSASHTQLQEEIRCPECNVEIFVEGIVW